MSKFNNTHLIHTVLGHAYLLFLVFFCLAIFVNRLYPFEFHSTTLEYIVIVLVFLGTFVIFWAQRASHISTKARLADDRTHEAFSVGPYAFLRTPTQTSLFLLMFGLGLVVDILWISIFAILSLIINYIIFVKKQDKILLKRYGASYEKYRSKVRF